MKKSGDPVDQVADRERGFTLVEMVVVLAIVSGILIFASSAFGVAPSRAHPAALALEAALVEARSVATMQQADGTDTGLPTGATVSVQIDPHNANQSIISVYRSRPIANPDESITGAPLETLMLPPDVGFPRQIVPAVFTLDEGPGKSNRGTFTVMISSAGYTSIQLGYAYGPTSPIITADPSCVEGGTTIAAESPGRTETHPFDCRNASYNTSVTM